MMIDNNNLGQCKYCGHTQQYLSYMQLTYIIHIAEMLSAGVEDSWEQEQTEIRKRVKQMAKQLLKKNRRE